MNRHFGEFFALLAFMVPVAMVSVWAWIEWTRPPLTMTQRDIDALVERKRSER